MTPEKIKQARQSMGLTQAEMAEKMGVCVDAVKQWESGRRKPRGPAIKMIEMLMGA
ncbi:MAG: helix-turn-helix domain-containing protein [Aeromonadaceae bacterium]